MIIEFGQSYERKGALVTQSLLVVEDGRIVRLFLGGEWITCCEPFTRASFNPDKVGGAWAMRDGEPAPLNETIRRALNDARKVEVLEAYDAYEAYA